MNTPTATAKPETIESRLNHIFSMGKIYPAVNLVMVAGEKMAVNVTEHQGETAMQFISLEHSDENGDPCAVNVLMGNDGAQTIYKHNDWMNTRKMARVFEAATAVRGYVTAKKAVN